MRLHAAFDLHGNNNFLAIIDGTGKRVFKKKLVNDPQLIVEVLKAYKKGIVGIVGGVDL